MMKKMLSKICTLALLSLPFLAVSAVETNAVSLLNDSESFVVAKAEKLGLKDDTGTGKISEKKKTSAGCKVDSDCRKGVCDKQTKICVTCLPATGAGCKNSQKCTSSHVCVDACKGVSCPAGKKVFDRTVAHACTCTACLVDTDCGQGNKCQTAANSANNSCKACSEGEGCNCPDDQVANGSGGCKCAPISCPNDGTPCGTKTLTNGKCACAEQSCDGGKVWSSKYCRCETPCPTGYTKDTSGNCTLCDVGYEKDILGACTKADSCEALGYVTAFSTEAGKECGDPETVATNEKGPTINGQSCYKCVYKTCAQLGTGLTDDAKTCDANRPYTVSPMSHAVLTEYRAGSGIYLPTRTGNTLLTASCVLCNSCTVYGQYCTACNSADGCTECKQSGYSIDAQGNCSNKCSGYVENEVCVPCSPGSKFKKSCSPCAAGEICGCPNGKVADGKGACVSCLTQQPACCGKGGIVNGCYVCDACKTDHFLLSGGMCVLQTCKQYYGNKTFNNKSTDSDLQACKNKGGYHVVPTKSAYPKSDCSSLSTSGECATCECCPAGQKAAKGDSDCSACPAGYKCPNTCMLAGVACNNGTYQDQTGQTACKTCPAGTYTPDDGKAYTACIPASCGYYVPSAGQNHQTACAPGTYQPNTGKTSCIEAACGQYVSAAASCTVSTCPAGTYQKNAKKTECVPASCGNYVPTEGLCSQTQCAPGTYQPNTGKTSCIEADCGNYVPTAGLCSQTQCDAGTYQPNKKQTSCIAASCGHYVPSKGQCGQTNCAKGYYQKDSGKTSCTAASAGYYVPSEAQCDQTAATCGHYVPTTAQSAPSTCAAGTYQPNTAQSGCLNATAGNYVAAAGACKQDSCPAGKYCPGEKVVTPTACACGTYSTGGAAACTECAKGYYQPATGQTSCKAADCGNYVTLTGQCAQSPCGAGGYNTGSANTQCSACPAGKYCPSDTTCTPTDCECGTYSTGGAKACTSCTPGYYTSVKASTSCGASSAGYYVSASKACSQTGCTTGFCSDTTAQTSCRACSTIPVTNGGCTACTSTCTCTKVECGEGYYIDGTTCKACPAGSYCTKGVKTACPAGTFTSTTGNASCNPCNNGKYQDQTGQTSCKTCAAGKWAASDKAYTACENCPPGHYASGTGNSGCKACEPGYHASGYGNGTCSPCNDGGYQDQSGQNTCKPCPAGTWSTTGTQPYTACTPCDPGTYTPITGRTFCSVCEAGTYASGTRNTSCTACPAVQYQDQTGQSSCKACTTPNGTCTACNAKTGACTAATCNSGYAWNGSSCNLVTCSAMGYTTSCGAGYGAKSAGFTGSDGTCYTCELCEEHYYSPGGTSACKSCSSGITCGWGASAASQCRTETACTADNPCASDRKCLGPHQSGSLCGTLAGNSTHGVCSPLSCPAGQQTTNHNCAACPAGTYKSSAGTGSCTTCPTPSDTTCKPKNGPCVDVPTGCNACNASTGACTEAKCPSTSVAHGGSECWYCDYVMQGCSTCSSMTSCTTCKSGYVKNGGCPAGKKWVSAGNQNHLTNIDSPCGTCQAAQTCAQINSSYKTSCPAGYYATSTGQTGTDGTCYTCSLCDEGGYSAGGTATSCTACPSGSITCGWGASSKSQCRTEKACTADSVCGTGYKCQSTLCGGLAGSGTHGVCTPVSKTCAQLNSNWKTSCPKGYGATYTSEVGTDGMCYTCALCDDYGYSAGGTSSCTACPSGSRTCGFGASSKSQCLDTSIYHMQTGCQSGYTDVSGTKCGTLAGSGTHNVCTKNPTCSSGTYLSNGSCVSCSNLGAPACTRCTSPSIPLTQATGCTACTTSGTCTAVSCPSGTRPTSNLDCEYCAAVFGTCASCNSTACTSCPSGYTSNTSCPSGQEWKQYGSICGKCETVSKTCAQINSNYKSYCAPGYGATKVSGVSGSDGQCYTCTLCDEDGYSPGGIGACIKCSSGQTCGKGASSASQCRTEQGCTGDWVCSPKKCVGPGPGNLCGILAGSSSHGVCQ